MSSARWRKKNYFRRAPPLFGYTSTISRGTVIHQSQESNCRFGITLAMRHKTLWSIPPTRSELSSLVAEHQNHDREVMGSTLTHCFLSPSGTNCYRRIGGDTPKLGRSGIAPALVYQAMDLKAYRGEISNQSVQS